MSSETGKAASCGILLTGETMNRFLRDWRPATSSPRLARGLSLSKAAESEGAVLFGLWYGGNRSPEPFGLESFDPELTTEGLMAERPVEGNAEPRFFEAGCKQVAEKTSP
jgi:hypothetical protein